MPATPTISVAATDNRLEITPVNSDTPNEGNRFYRKAVGEYGDAYILIAEGVDPDDPFYDGAAKSGVLYTYKVEAVNSGVGAMSAAATGLVDLSTMTIHGVRKVLDDPIIASNITDIGITPLYIQEGMVREQQRASATFAMGGAGQKTAPGLITGNRWSGEIFIPGNDPGTIGPLRELFEAKVQCCLRDTLGNRLFGALVELSFTYGINTRAQITFLGNSYDETIIAADAASPVFINGYTFDEVMRVTRGYYGIPVYRRRFESLDVHLNKVRDLENVFNADIQYISDRDIQRAATFDIREDTIELDAFSDQVIALEGLLFYLKLNEASGNALDSSGASRTFAANGGITYGVGPLLPGEPTDTAITLNGSNAYYSIADAAWMDVTRITLGIAFQIDTIPAFGTVGTLIARAGSGTPAFTFRVQATTGYLELILWFGGVLTQFATTANVCDGKKHFGAATYDGAYVQIFIDGVEVLRTAQTGNIDAGNTTLRVGANAAAVNFFNGSVQKAFMANRALTANELRDLWQAGAGDYSEILYDQSLIKGNKAIQMPTEGADGTFWAEWPVGVFKPVSNTRQTTATGIYRRVQGFDYVTHHLANSKLDTRWTIPATENYLTGDHGILALIAATGLSTSSFTITPTAYTFPVETDIPVDANVLIEVNRLLLEIGYDPIRGTADGGAVIAPKISPSSRASEITLTTDLNSVIAVEGELVLVTDRVPNKISVVTETVDRVPDKGEAENTSIFSPLSIVYRGTKPRTIYVSAVDSTVANTLAQIDLERRTAKAYSSLKVSVIPLPWFGHEVRATIHHTGFPYALGITDEFLCRSWNLRLSDSPQVMALEFEVVVSL